MGNEDNFKLKGNPVFEKMLEISKIVLSRLDKDNDNSLTLKEFGPLDFDGDMKFTTVDLERFLEKNAPAIHKNYKAVYNEASNDNYAELVDKNLRQIPFYGKVFPDLVCDIKVLTARHNIRQSELGWYNILNSKATIDPEAGASFLTFLSLLEKIVNDYNNNGTIDPDDKCKSLNLLVDNYPCPYEFFVGFFKRLESGHANRAEIENSLFLINHCLNFFDTSTPSEEQKLTLSLDPSKTGRPKIILHGAQETRGCIASH